MSTLRFYVTAEQMSSGDFSFMVHQGATCKNFSGENFVQFEDDFLTLQPSSFLSPKLLGYLNSLTNKVTLRHTISENSLIEGLQNMTEFRFSLPDGKFSRTGYVVLVEAESSYHVYRLIHDFLPNMFPKPNILPFNGPLKGMTFRSKLRLLLFQLNPLKLPLWFMIGFMLLVGLTSLGLGIYFLHEYQTGAHACSLIYSSALLMAGGIIDLIIFGSLTALRAVRQR